MIVPPIRKGIDIRNIMLTFNPCARASSAPQQTAHAQALAGSPPTPTAALRNTHFHPRLLHPCIYRPQALLSN
jgi:hypothetical protein